MSNAPLPFGDVRPGPATLVATSAPGLTQVPLPLASHHGVHVDRRAEGRRDRPAVRRVPAGRFPVLEGTPHRPLSRRSAVRSRTCTFFPRSAHVLRATSPRSPAGRQPSGAQGSAVRSALHCCVPRCTMVRHCATAWRDVALVPVHCYPRVSARLHTDAARPLWPSLAVIRPPSPSRGCAWSSHAPFAARGQRRRSNGGQTALVLQTAYCLFFSRARRRWSADGEMGGRRCNMLHGISMLCCTVFACLQQPLTGRPTSSRRT